VSENGSGAKHSGICYFSELASSSETMIGDNLGHLNETIGYYLIDNWSSTWRIL